MKKFLLPLFAIFLFGCQNIPVENTEKNPPYISIGEQAFSLEVADNNTKRQIGLMWREQMDLDHGMLFIFEQESKPSFWMKNTLIPLDIIWLSKDLEVVDFKTMKPCPPESVRCPSATPKAAAQYVLELNAGVFSGKIGDTATLIMQ